MESSLIDRQAAIEVIDAVFPVDPMKSEYAQGIACGAALAKTYVEQLPSAQPDREDLVEKIKNGITASDGNNEYFIGLRNGMRWCLSLIDDKEPIYESSVQPDHSGDVNEMVESAYTEGYTYAESKYRKMWEEMQLSKESTTSDCISRQDAIDLIEGIETERLKGNIELIYASAIKGLRSLPSAQPEIIRCKDCVHWFDIDNGRQIHTMCASIDGDWFCGDAERRTDEAD